MIDDWLPGCLVVGLPDPALAAAVAERVQEFIIELRGRYDLPVEAVDESFTSRAASTELREARRSGRLTTRLKKASIDSYAACLIAEQWMHT
jgi:putative Holliday junction resolvase